MKKNQSERGSGGRGWERENIYFLFFSSLRFFLKSMKIEQQVFVGK